MKKYITYTYFGDNGPEERFITVLDQFEHHYTKDMMYHIRIESVDKWTRTPIVEYKTVTEDYLNNILSKVETY